MEWFRMYHGMPFDTKLRVIAKRANQPMGVAVVVWACILDAASQADPRGIAVVDPEEIAVALDFDVEAVEAVIRTAMRRSSLNHYLINVRIFELAKVRHMLATGRKSFCFAVS
jgi:hypothetical protein